MSSYLKRNIMGYPYNINTSGMRFRKTKNSNLIDQGTQRIFKSLRVIMPLFYQDDDEDEAATSSEGRPPPAVTHCDVPLKYDKQRAALLKPGIGQYCRPGNRHQRELKRIERVSHVKRIHFFDTSHVQRLLLTKWNPDNQSLLMSEFLNQINGAEQLWKIQSAALNDLSDVKIAFSDYILTPDQKNILFPYYLRKAFFEELILATSNFRTFKDKFWFTKKEEVIYAHADTVCFYATENLCLIQTKDLKFLISRDQLLCLADLAAQRYALVKHTLLTEQDPIKRLPSLGWLMEFLDWGDEVLEQGGNEAYSIVYKMEPLAVSFLVGDLPVGSKSGITFYNLMVQELISASLPLGLTELAKKLLALLKIAYQTGPQCISESFGLYRIWGHPTLEPLEGVSALKAIATHVRFTNVGFAKKIIRKFKEEFIIRYIAKEQSWPSLDISRLPPGNVIRIAYENRSTFPRRHKRYSRAHLDLVKFGPLWGIDPKFDLTELITDKSLSLLTSELIECIRVHHHCGSAMARSVLLNWLTSDLIDPEKFLREIDVNGFPPEERTVGTREKEREGKLKARLFGLMTLSKRMYIVLTEALLAEYIIPYFPEITMIDDELSLDKKRYHFTQKTHHDSIMISLDFSKWNSNMRKNETLELFQSFDDMFGLTECFARTHEMFEKSKLYLLNGSYVPKADGEGSLLEDLGTWSGHLGGIEGLRQKGWTIWTVSIILLAAEDLNFKLKLMGQGDNQVLKLTFPLDTSKDENDTTLYGFLDSLNNILAHIGPPLKLEETWASRDLYIYGKYIIYRGAPLTMSLKRLIRMFRLSNEDYPTMEAAISSLSANLTSALASDCCIGSLLISYFSELIAAIQLGFRNTTLQSISIQDRLSQSNSFTLPGKVRNHLILKPLTTQKQSLPQNLILGLATFPRALGGFPVMNIFNCLLRGFPDEVSFAISSLKRIYFHSPPFLQNLIENMCQPSLNPDMNYSLILEHPTVLNLELPSAPSEARRNLILDFLSSGSVNANKYVKTFLGVLKESEHNELVNYLTEVEPFDPRLLSTLVDATAFSRAREVAGKLIKTKTISEFARTKGRLNLYRKIESSEFEHTLGILRLLTQRSTNTVAWNPFKCSVTHACDLRRQGWGKEIVGVDCVPPQEFMFFENTSTSLKCNERLECDKGYVSIRLDPLLTSSQLSDPFVMGNFPPYRGSITRQKVSGYGDKIASQAEPVLQKTLRAFSLVGWGIPVGGNLHKLCIKLLDARTDYDSAILTPLDEELTGSVHHRLQDERTGHGGSVPVLSNMGSRMVFDTFPLSAYSKGSKNVNLMFQSFMSASVVFVGELIATGWIPSMPVYHLHVETSCCVREVSQILPEHPNPPDTVNLIKDIANPFLYTPKEKIESLVQKGFRFTPNRALIQDSRHILQRYHSILAEECLRMISPHSWDRAIFSTPTQQLVINWALKTHLGLLIHHLSLRLCAFYLSSCDHLSPPEFLSQVAEKVKRSPIEHWTKIANLIFAPDFHHHLVGNGIKSRINGNPICGLTSVARNLQRAIVTCLTGWSVTSDLKSIIGRLHVFSRPHCGIGQHPTMILLTRDWLMGTRSIGSTLTLRSCALKFLGGESDTHLSPDLKRTVMAYIQEGAQRITSEVLDVLCKDSRIKIPRPLSLKTPKLSLPKAGQIVLTLTRKDLEFRTLLIDPTILNIKSTCYDKHLLKIAPVPTGGPYKVLSILQEINLKNPKLILCLGDGSGGFTLGCLKTFEDSIVYYNSLVTSDLPMQQCPPISYIPALAGYPDLEERVRGLEIVNGRISDITHPRMGELLKQELPETPDALFSDAEITGPYAVNLGSNLIDGLVRISLEIECPVLIVKVYAKVPSLLTYQISKVLTVYKTVQLFRSEFSSNHNTELYLIASGFAPSESLIKGSPHRWVGSILRQSAQSFLTDLNTELQITSTSINHTAAVQYSQFLGDITTKSLIVALKTEIPSVYPEGLNVFPLKVSNWIKQTSMREAGAPRLGGPNLVTSTLHSSYIKSWIINYLFFYFSLNLDKSSDWVHYVLDNFSLIWFKMNNDRWDTSLYNCERGLPPGIQRHFRYFRIRDFLKASDHKVIFKLVGLGSFLKLRFCSIYVDKTEERRGNVWREGESVTVAYQAKSEWVQHQLQSITSLNHKPTLQVWNVAKLRERYQRRLEGKRG
nr:TPA_asm: RdRp [Alphahymrhavirus sp. 'ectemnius']